MCLMGTETRYTLRCNTASIMKVFLWFLPRLLTDEHKWLQVIVT